MSAAAPATSTGLRGQLEGVVGRDHVRTDEGALVTFSTDATPLERGRPDAVVFPATAEEVAGVLRVANERGIPVVPRGSGTNLSAGTVPHRGGIVLGYAIAALGRWLVTAVVLTVIALAVGMNVGGSGIDLVGLYTLAVILNAAAVLWAVPRPERPREAVANVVCERVARA